MVSHEGIVSHVDCVFCRIVAGEIPADFVLQETEVVAFLDARPVFPGHVLVIPREHHETLWDLPAELRNTLFEVTTRVSIAVRVATDSDGIFMANNNIVSQSVPHFHAHVVPRKRKDGLRGFFWPRGKYAQGEAATMAASIRTHLTAP
jgi:histidine triad (HIT) family protein